MRQRSLIRHTGLDNTLAPMFEREDALHALLSGSARLSDDRDTRFRLGQWPALREATLQNLAAIATDYTPFREVVDALAPVLGPELVTAHVERMRRLLGIDAFVTAVRNRVGAFDAGLRDVAAGRRPVSDLAALHTALVEAYSSYTIFPNRRNM